MPTPRKKRLAAVTLFGLLFVAIPSCQRRNQFPPPPSPCPPPLVPVTITLAGTNLKVDPSDAHLSVTCNQYAEWSAGPGIDDFAVIFKPFKDDDPKKPKKRFDTPNCANKKCKTSVPVQDHYGKHPYAVIALVSGKLVVLDPQVNVDP